MTNKVADLGAQTALLLPPFYYKAAYSDSVLEDYFIDVANSAKIPVLIYNSMINDDEYQTKRNKKLNLIRFFV